MVRTDKIRGMMAEQGVMCKDMAKALGMTPKTFTLRMKSGVFGSDEMETMIEILHIENPADIFFAKE